jgi:hypothetical protein
VKITTPTVSSYSLFPQVLVVSDAIKKMIKPTITKRKDAENAPIFLRSKLLLNTLVAIVVAVIDLSYNFAV